MLIVSYIALLDLDHAEQDDVDFTRYMAENFSAFDYKTQEEVFTVIKYLTTVLSTTGTQLLETISPSHLLTHLHNAPNPTPVLPDSSTVRSISNYACLLKSHLTQQDAMDVVTEDNGENKLNLDIHRMVLIEVILAVVPPNLQDQVSLMRNSVIIAMVMLLKAHLKALYSLSEE